MANESATLSSPSSSFWIPLSLVCLGAFPAFVGVERLASFAPHGPKLPDAQRFADHPVGLVVHIVSALLYTLLGALQFSPALRQRGALWHRVAGRVAAPAGMIVGLSGLWVMLVYPAAADADPVRHAMRVVSGVSMLAFLAIGLFALRRHAYRAHGRWMLRAYAIGIAGGTQAALILPMMLLFGIEAGAGITVAMAAGWLINVITAEYILRSRIRTEGKCLAAATA